MRNTNLLLSAIHFFVVIIILSCGAFFLAIPHAAHVKVLLINAITERGDLLSLIGYAFLLVGAMLLTGFYALYRRPYLHLMMTSTADVEPGLIRDYLNTYWGELFPKDDLVTDIIINSDQKIEIIAEMPELGFNQQKIVLEKIEKELGDLLARNLGYKREFLVSLIIKPAAH